MRSKKARIFLACFTLLLFSSIAIGPVMSKVEQPVYQILNKDEKIEIRQYPSIIVASVNVSGERNEAIQAGFNQLADYIFGNNIKASSIAMTAPVTQETNAKIAMTAPVLQEPSNQGWIIRFSMPSEYTLATLPKPNNPNIFLEELNAKKKVVIQFSGRASQENILKNERKLQVFIESNNLKPLSPVVYAFYNPPWTLPFMRRNEIMIEVK